MSEYDSSENWRLIDLMWKQWAVGAAVVVPVSFVYIWLACTFVPGAPGIIIFLGLFLVIGCCFVPMFITNHRLSKRQRADELVGQG